MDYFSSTIHEYQPILVGAGCLALGYMYGRHCRCLMENQGDAPTTSDAACCAGTESFNYIPEPAAVDPETMAMVRQWLNPAEADWDYSDRELTEKPERCAKRDVGQLEILPRKNEDTIWNQNVFKKQKSAPAVRREVVRTKAESEQDSDDEVLAQRLEFFNKSLSGTRASINRKPREHDLLKLSKDHPTADVATSREEAKNAQEIATNSPRKGAARSLSGLGALATPHDDDDQGESSPGSSLEDTCRSPRTVCLDHCSDGNDDVDDQQDALERSCQVELTNSAPQAETVTLVRVNCTLSNDPASEDVDQLVGDDMSVGLMESEDHTAVENAADERTNAHKEADTAGRQDCLRLELPTSPPPELLQGEQEAKAVREEEDAVPAAIDKQALQAEINERLQLHKDSGEKKKSKVSRSSCLGATTKHIRFRWLGKLASSWRKRSKLWRRRNNKPKQTAAANTEASRSGQFM